MERIDLHLASSSERRRDILQSLGLRFTWGGEELDETPQDNESAADLAKRLALAKVAAARRERPQVAVILGADTVVSLGEKLLGKPRDRDDVLQMLEKLSDRTHQVVTAVAINAAGNAMTGMSITQVRFRQIAADEANAYWKSGEPFGKAGAYAIQGRGGVFVRSISGSYSGVVGLPVYETADLLRRAGIDVNANCSVAPMEADRVR